MPAESDSRDPVRELRDLPHEVTPDASVERRVIDALRGEALLRGPGRSRNTVPWVLAAGMALVAFGLGTLTGRDPSATTPNATFALMLYGGSTGNDSLEHELRASEYRRWAEAAHAAGRVLGGEALGDSVGAVGVLTLARTSELVGFFLIAAPDRAAAVRLAAACPHIKYGGSVVVRAILPT